jgi:peptidylprolyl isomerase
MAFPFGQGGFIEGWLEGMTLLREGDKVRLIIPGNLAYGPEGRPPSIPPDATLIFDMELVSIAEGAPQAPAEVDPADYLLSDSGIQYYDVVEGDGPALESGQVAIIHFTVWQEDGTIFDSTLERGQPIQMAVRSDQIPAGWQEGLLNMQIGGERQLVVPVELAFGAEQAAQTGIPPGSELVFDVQLLDITEGAPESPSEVDSDDYEQSDSGLQYYDLEEGDGSALEEGQVAIIHYTVWLEDGTLVDSSLDRGQPIQMLVGGGQNIAGWEEGLMTMHVGGKRQMVIPAELAFGEEGAGGGFIPPNAVLILELEVLDAQSPPQ